MTNEEIDATIAERFEARHRSAAVSWGLSVEEAQAEYENPMTLMATAEALVAEADADPGWWERRRGKRCDTCEGEAEYAHYIRLKRLMFFRELVAMPKDPAVLAWASAHATRLWAAAKAAHLDRAAATRAAHGEARRAHVVYREAHGVDGPASLNNAVHRAIAVLSQEP